MYVYIRVYRGTHIHTHGDMYVYTDFIHILV